MENLEPYLLPQLEAAGETSAGFVFSISIQLQKLFIFEHVTAKAVKKNRVLVQHFAYRIEKCNQNMVHNRFVFKTDWGTQDAQR